MIETTLEYRMYFLVPYNIMPIQQGIQAGHCIEQYAYKYGQDPIYRNYVKNHKTWIILNGGTTNTNNGSNFGTLDRYAYDLENLGIEHATFHEPDLNDALTAVCVLCDERVFNNTKYPLFKDYLKSRLSLSTHELVRFNYDDAIEAYPSHYLNWLAFVGGKSNAYLKFKFSTLKLA